MEMPVGTLHRQPTSRISADKAQMFRGIAFNLYNKRF